MTAVQALVKSILNRKHKTKSVYLLCIQTDFLEVCKGLLGDRYTCGVPGKIIVDGINYYPTLIGSHKPDMSYDVHVCSHKLNVKDKKFIRSWYEK